MTAASPADAPPEVRRRFEHFTALRGIAVLGVVVFHVASITGAIDGSFTGKVALLLGSIGPIVFFVLSGFLLFRPFVAAGVLGREQPSLSRYARRRALRILPPYWTALTLLAIFPGVVGAFSGDWWRFYGFLQSYSAETFGQGIPVAWTLCVEVSFYLLLPVWVLALRRASLRVHLIALAVVAVAGVVVQVLAAQQDVSRLVANALPGQVTWFALGMALAVWSVAAEGREPRVPALGSWVVALAALVILALTIEAATLLEVAQRLGQVEPVWPVLRQIALTAVLSVFLLLPAMFGEQAGGFPRRFLAWRPVAYLGTISYSVFLYHLTIAELLALDDDPGHFEQPGLGLLDDLGGAPTPILLALTLLVTVAVASISYRLVERPFVGESAR